jgi:hypothetical protein
MRVVARVEHGEVEPAVGGQFGGHVTALRSGRAVMRRQRDAFDGVVVEVRQRVRQGALLENLSE